MKLERALRIKSITLLPTKRYVIKADFSTLNFDEESLNNFGITLDEGCVGKYLIVYLEDIQKHPQTPYELLIFQITNRLYGSEFLDKPSVISNTHRLVRLGSRIPKGFPSFDLILELTEEKYQEIRKLPENAVLLLKQLKIEDSPINILEELEV
ncbi:MAG: hypothetical protein QXX38_02760 [Candidatus Aenigmatarchaeota archaeon]